MKDITKSLSYIKKNCPVLHLYVCGKLLEKTKTNIISLDKIRSILGTIFHIPRQFQNPIIRELISMKLLIRKSRGELIITITKDEYNSLINYG